MIGEAPLLTATAHPETPARTRAAEDQGRGRRAVTANQHLDMALRGGLTEPGAAQ
jgi:hypothetical protein